MIPIIIGQLSKAGPAAVQRVLADWSAVGILSDMIWVDCDQVGEVMLGTHLSQSVARPVDVTQWFAEHPREGRRVCVFDLWGWRGETGMADPGRVHDWISGWLRGVDVLHVVGVAADANTVPASAIPSSKNVIVLSCLESATPEAFANPIRSSDPGFIAHAAAGLAGAARLWSWSDVGADDWVPTANLRRARVGRSFVRVVDSRPLLQAVLDEVTGSVADGLPAAIDVGRQQRELPQVTAPAACVDNLAKAVLDCNKTLARFNPPARAAGAQQQSLGFWKAVKYFLGYVVESIKNAPGEIVRAVKTKVEERVVKTLDPLYGKDSRFKVVLTEKRAEQANRLGAALAAQAAEEVRRGNPNWSPAPPQARALWTDCFQAACGLVDGQAPSSPALERAMPHQGDSPQVLTQPRFIAPDPSGPSFTVDLPDQSVEVRPTNPVTARLVARVLEESIAAAREPQLQTRLREIQERFKQWIDKQHSFAWQVGWGVAESLIQASAYQANLLRQTTDTESSEWQQRLAKSVRALKVRSLVILVLTVLGLVGVGLLTGFGVVLWPVACGIAVGWLLVMYLAALTICFKHIAVRFNAENAEKEDLLARDDAKKQALIAVAEEVVRLGGIADQASAWVAILSELAHHTGGFNKRQEVAGDVILTGALPLSMQIAQVVYTPDVNTVVGRAQMKFANSAKAGLLATGWFQGLAKARLKLAGQQWCARHDIPDDEMLDQVLDDSQQAADGPLAAAAENLVDESNRAKSTFVDKLRSWVQGPGRDSWRQAQSGAHLMAGIDSAFEADSMMSELLDSAPGICREDISQVGQGRQRHSGLSDMFPPALMNLGEAADNQAGDQLVQAVCRVVVTQSLEVSDLRCCEGDSAGVRADDDGVIEPPRPSPASPPPPMPPPPPPGATAPEDPDGGFIPRFGR